ncbi:uncharacterized protein N7483_004060 [Penicillium malachiteum]|uniref:uncharacterized protein n=1 Tax=Penicillium malachiteum TaxID=1324776 RepID=UPI002546A1BF|nr:uncharacterized protein N7483_004060 [Penicillium malachiteum]KAJ5729552.1 hypothetical protein N7483_004060 [Penicillium malachiteum]
MATKRKIPPRAGRESANKKRASDAVATQSQTKKAPTPRVPSAPPEPVELPLPSRVREGEALPFRRARQPTNLSNQEYQSIAESAVLFTALERSKKKWVSDGILVRYYTKPKKTKRDQIEKLNPPKDSMTKVGLCDVTIGPHQFDAMLYTVKDPLAPQPIQYTPPQAQARMVHYGPGNNFQQHQPYHSNQQRRPPYSAAAPGRQQGYQGNYSPAPRGPHQSTMTPSGQRSQPPSQSGQPAKPSPDPVIQMLATRAAADPDLKALMRVVASSQASQEQLRAFQAHIDELNAIIKAREQQEKRLQAPTTPQAHQPATPTPSNKPHPPQNSTQLKPVPSAHSPQEKASKPQQPAGSVQTPGKDASQQPPASQPTGSSKPQSDIPPHQPIQPQTPAPAPAPKGDPASVSQTSDPSVRQEPMGRASVQSQQTSLQPAPSAGPVNTSTPTPGPQSQGTAAPAIPPLNAAQQSTPRPASIPPARPGFKSVVFEFTSPLTPYGNSASGHAGSGDRYLFPEHSILEWLPNENTIIASFLITRKVDPDTPFPIETVPETATSRAKGKGASKSKKGDKKGKAEKGKSVPDTPTPNQPGTSTAADGTPATETSANPAQSSPAPVGSATPNEPPAKEVKLKEYWQAVTFRIHAADTRILEPLTRVVKPADEVRKYMNEIMDRAERAPAGFLALRLPTEEAREISEAEGATALTANAASRSRAARGISAKLTEDESELDTNVLDLEQEEEDLLDFYDAPMGLPPLRV